MKTRARAKGISKAVGVRWDQAEVAVTLKEMMSPSRMTRSRDTAAQSQCGICGDRYAISAETERNWICYYLLRITHKRCSLQPLSLNRKDDFFHIGAERFAVKCPPSSWLQPPSLQTPTKEVGLWGMPLRLKNVGYGSRCGGPVDSSPSSHERRLSSLSTRHLERWIWVLFGKLPHSEANTSRLVALWMRFGMLWRFAEILFHPEP